MSGLDQRESTGGCKRNYQGPTGYAAALLPGLFPVDQDDLDGEDGPRPAALLRQEDRRAETLRATRSRILQGTAQARAIFLSKGQAAPSPLSDPPCPSARRGRKHPREARTQNASSSPCPPDPLARSLEPHPKLGPRRWMRGGATAFGSRTTGSPVTTGYTPKQVAQMLRSQREQLVAQHERKSRMLLAAQRASLEAFFTRRMQEQQALARAKLPDHSSSYIS